MKKTDRPWSNMYTIFTAFVILLSLMVHITFDSLYQIAPEGNFIKRPLCYDTDFGKNFTKKGAVVIIDEQKGNIVKEDECIEKGLLEYYCTGGNYSYEIKSCNCIDGRCAG